MSKYFSLLMEEDDKELLMKGINKKEISEEFPVVEFFEDGEIEIFLKGSRSRFRLSRKGDLVDLECDLGNVSSAVDLCHIFQVDIFESDYQAAINLDPRFIKLAHSFENNFYVEKFVRARKAWILEEQKEIKESIWRQIRWRQASPGSVFGDWKSQVYVQLAQPTHERIANLEFSIFKADYLDEQPLEKPVFALLGSLQLRGKIAHYFLFIDWLEGDEYFWSYQKNFFYNNTIFPR